MTIDATLRPVVDVCSIHFDAAGWEAYLRTFADVSPDYLRQFGASLVQRAGADPEEYASALAEDAHKAVDSLLGAGGLEVSTSAHVATLRAQGVRHQVLHGLQRRLGDGTGVNDRIAQMAAQYPDVLSAWGGLDLSDPDAALAELEHCALDLGLQGASIVHWWGSRPPRDPGCHRVYARAAELGVKLWLHTGMSFARARAMDYCDWRDIDHIAGAHPDLVVVAGHGGWPWVLEGMAVLQRHPNVYLDISAHRPRHMARPGSGWESLLNYGRSIVRDRIVFGSVTWVHTVDIAQLAREVEELDLGESTTRAWLHDNAARLLGLPQETS